MNNSPILLHNDIYDQEESNHSNPKEAKKSAQFYLHAKPKKSPNKKTNKQIIHFIDHNI